MNNMNTNTELSAIDKFKLRYAQKKVEQTKKVEHKKEIKENNKISSFNALDSIVIQKNDSVETKIEVKPEPIKIEVPTAKIVDEPVRESLLDKYIRGIAEASGKKEKTIDEMSTDFYQKQKEENPFKKIPVNRLPLVKEVKVETPAVVEETSVNNDIIVDESKKDVFTRTCPHCGVEFTTSNKTKVYCCDKCRKAAGDKKRNRNPNAVVYHRICPTCQKHFDTKNKFQLYCDEHKGAGHKKTSTTQQVRKPSNAYVYKDVKRRMSCVGEYINGEKIYHVTINCIHCGEMFTYDTKNIGQYRAFCSRKCEDAHRGRKR